MQNLKFKEVASALYFQAIFFHLNTRTRSKVMNNLCLNLAWIVNFMLFGENWVLATFYGSTFGGWHLSISQLYKCYRTYNERKPKTFKRYEMIVSSLSSYSFVTEMVSKGNIEQNHKKTLTGSQIQIMTHQVMEQMFLQPFRRGPLKMSTFSKIILDCSRTEHGIIIFLNFIKMSTFQFIKMSTIQFFSKCRLLFYQNVDISIKI